MHFSRVIIENFRSISRLDVDLDEPTIVFIGENGAGKSSVLDAIRRVIRPRADKGGCGCLTSDFQDPEDWQPAKPISVTLYLDRARNRQLDFLWDVEDFEIKSGQNVRVRLEANFDGHVATEKWSLLDIQDKPIVADNLRVNDVRTYLGWNTFYFSTERDPKEVFTRQSRFWDSVGQHPLHAHRFEDVIQKILAPDTDPDDSKAWEIYPYNPELWDKLMAFMNEEASTLPDDLLRNALRRMAELEGAKVPVPSRSSGRVGLMILLFFRLMQRASCRQPGYPPEFDPPLTLLLEEPELHLHPAAIRLFAKIISGVKGQKFFATHSGEIVSQYPLTSVRRLCRRGGKVTIHSLNKTRVEQDKEELRKVSFHIHAHRAEMLFSRCWLLGEGQTEYWLLNAASEILKIDLVESGIRIFTDIAIAGVRPIVKLANDMGIHWHLLADGDNQGKDNVQQAKAELVGGVIAEHITVLPAENIEIYLCQSKQEYGELYEANIVARNRHRLSQLRNSPEYWKEVLNIQKGKGNKYKITMIHRVIQKMSELGEAGVPDEIRTAFMKCMKLSQL